MMVCIWCGAARFEHADITRPDAALVRLFGWGKAAGHKAIVSLYQRVGQPIASRLQTSSYSYHLSSSTLLYFVLEFALY